MTPERWRQVKELFNAALEHDREERLAFLETACAGDEELRREVDALLAADEHPSHMVDQPLSEIAATLLEPSLLPSLIGSQLGHYKILKEIGRGGMGEVYLARDARLSRPVAIKLLPASFIHDHGRVRRFQQEARAASALNHPNIVTIHEIGEADGLRFLVTEFVEGQTLRAALQSEMPLRQALDIAIQTAGALAAAHEAGIT